MNWTCIEPGVYLITACLPSFRPFFGYFASRFWKRVTTSKASKAEWSTSGRDKRERFQRLGDNGTPLPQWNDSVTKLTSNAPGESRTRKNKPLPLIDWADVATNVVPPSSVASRDHTSLEAGQLEESRLDQQSLRAVAP